jgi:integrase
MDKRSFQRSINTPVVSYILGPAYKDSVGLKDFPQLDPIPAHDDKRDKGKSLGSHRTCILFRSFCCLGRARAFELQNLRLKSITLHNFRHWKATMQYNKTRDIFHVQRLLGHKNIQNTAIYITLENSVFQAKDDEFHVAVANRKKHTSL